MKKAFWMLCLIALCIPVVGYSDSGIVAVTAKAEKAFEPNILHLNLEIWSQATTAKQAQQMAAKQYQDLQKIFTEQKIRKEDVQTENYSLSPSYEYNQKTQKNQLVGFKALQTLKVTLRKVELGGAFMDVVATGSKTSGVGVNIQNIQWDTDQRVQAQAKLLTEAVQLARAQADILAKAAGTSVKSVKRLQPVTGDQQQEPHFKRTFALEMASSVPGTELSAGQVKVTAEVQAEYELK